MDEVIVISEECHGLIGVAKDVPRVIDFLCEGNWLWEGTEIFIESEGWKSIKETFGNCWKTYLKALSLSELQDIFEGCFYFHQEKVY